MKVITLKKFRDKATGKIYNPGAVFSCAKARAEYLHNLGFVEIQKKENTEYGGSDDDRN